MTDDAFTRDVFERLSVPPESSRFFIELDERLRRRERDATRKWKRTALVFAIVAAAAVGAAGVMASTPSAAATVVDQTVVCTNIVKAGLPVFDAGAKPTPGPTLDENGKIRKPPPGFSPPTSMYVQTGDVMMLLTFSSGVSGYQLDRSRCIHTRQKLSFGPHGLPWALTLGANAAEQFGRRCTNVGKMAMRIQIVNDGLGVPLRAKLLIVRATTGKPLLYVEWARTLVKSWASPGCDPYEGVVP